MAGLLFPLLLLVVMYFFLIAPQRKKQRAHVDLLSTIGPGDEVVTSGGIYGGVTEVDGDDLYLEIAPDVEIKVSKRAIADRTYKAPAAGTPAVPKPLESADAQPDDEGETGDKGDRGDKGDKGGNNKSAKK